MEDYIETLIIKRNNLINVVNLREKELKESRVLLKITEKKIAEYWRNYDDNSKIK